MTAYEVGWLVGLLEGEGCFSVRGPFPSRPTRRPALTISLQMTDEDIVRKAAKRMGGAAVSSSERNGTKRIYRTEICGRRAADLMHDLAPLMGSRRQQRITELLAMEGLSHHER